MNTNVKKGENAVSSHMNVGDLSSFAGKAFVKENLGSTSCEISVGSLGAGEAVPFLHHHRCNEEHYIFISGVGHFEVSSEEFDVTSGSVVRVSPEGVRGLKNVGTTP
ncbi:MAG: cupin domain-containing protein, partial [Muribaculaceae bacterium]